MLTLKARFDGRVFIPEGPVHLPADTEVEIAVAPAASSAPATRPPLAQLVELLDQFPSDPDWPADGAAQHDHYLYGTPKRPCP